MENIPIPFLLMQIINYHDDRMYQGSQNLIENFISHNLFVCLLF